MANEESEYNSNDEEIDVKQHKKLIKNVLNLNKKEHVSKPSRTEPSLEISEFNLVNSIRSKDGTVQLDDLTKVFKKHKTLSSIDKKLKSVQKKAQTLAKPLEKPQADRIRRTVGYQKTRLELDRWDAVVAAHRGAEHLKFPLKIDVKLKANEKPEFKFRVKSELEKELELTKPKEEVFRIDLEEQRVPLTMKEILEKRKEAAKLRAHMSFKEAKARRQNKIKSKKYHRIQRREKIKKQLEEFELLQKTNPEAALQKLEEIEKARAEERISLRHKGTGKWAKSKQIRAKYDKESRKVLAQQLSISKELTQKAKIVHSSESEGEDVAVESSAAAKDNPWIKGKKSENEIDSFLSGYRKYWEKENESKGNNVSTALKNDENAVQNLPNADQTEQEKTLITPTPKKNLQNGNKKSRKLVDKKSKKVAVRKEISCDSIWDVTTISNEIDDAFDSFENKLANKLKIKHAKIKKSLQKNAKANRKETGKRKSKKIDLSLAPRAIKPILDDELIMNDEEQKRQNSADDIVAILRKDDASKPPKKEEARKEAKIVQLNTKLPDLFLMDDNEDELAQREAIAGAFEDEDVVDEFNKEKQEDIKDNTPKDIDLNLPGWGSWGGKNIPLLKRKRKRFIIRTPKKAPRRDENKGNVIIYEGGNKEVKNHLVSDLPFPFKTVEDYQASVRAPIGSTFVPETAFRKLTLPAVKTKIGAIIEPLNDDILLKEKYKA